MGSKPKAPKAPDPMELIRAQNANRVSTVSPFGSETYNGNTLTRSYSPAMQGLADRAIGLAGKDSEKFENPAWMGGLMNSIGQRQADKYAPGGAKQSGAQPMQRPGGIRPGMSPGGIVQQDPQTFAKPAIGGGQSWGMDPGLPGGDFTKPGIGQSMKPPEMGPGLQFPNPDKLAPPPGGSIGLPPMGGGVPSIGGALGQPNPALAQLFGGGTRQQTRFPQGV